MGTGINASMDYRDGGLFTRTFPSTDWVCAHDDLKTVTANASTVLLRPSTYSDSNAHPIRVPAGAQRLFLRARYGVGVTAVTASPAIAVFGAYGPDSGYNAETGVFDDTGVIKWIRLDASGTVSGMNIGAFTPTFVPTLTGGIYQDMRDTNWRYTGMGGDIAGTNNYYIGFELFGCEWVLCLVSTAATTTGTGNVAMKLDAAFYCGNAAPYAVPI
jgi:hypothetical protein